MKRDFTKRPFRPQFRYGEGENSGSAGAMSPFGAGEKPPTFALPLPTNPVTGAGRSRSITASDGPEEYPWCRPASGVKKP